VRQPPAADLLAGADERVRDHVQRCGIALAAGVALGAEDEAR